MVKNLFIFENHYYEFNSMDLLNKGKKKSAEVADFICNCLGNQDVQVIFDSQKPWIYESAKVVQEILMSSIDPKRSIDLTTFNRLNGNAEAMVEFINENCTCENVILITSTVGIMDLIDEFRKFRPGTECFYKKLDSLPLNKLKSGRLSFVGFPNKRIKKEMYRIPFSKRTADKNSRMAVSR